MNSLPIWLLALAALTVPVNLPLWAQADTPPIPETGSIVGTVTDETDQTVSGARVVLQGPTPEDYGTVTTNAQGFYELHDLKPGISYHILISADGFAQWTSPEILLHPGTSRIVNGTLKIASVVTNVTVTPSTTEEIATEEIHQELQQRVLGFIPNFWVSYDPNPVPLTPKLKFKLAYRVAFDPVTFGAIAFYSGIQQAAGMPNYQQGVKGYGQRFGANAGDSFSDTLIGGAILPSILHQDPRYFYKGTGTIESRLLYALRSPFVCKGDDGNWQPNYSSMGGDLASSALDQAYLPQSNRGVAYLFETFAIDTAEREVSTIFQEFVLRKFTKKAPPQN